MEDKADVFVLKAIPVFFGFFTSQSLTLSSHIASDKCSIQIQSFSVKDLEMLRTGIR